MDVWGARSSCTSFLPSGASSARCALASTCAQVELCGFRILVAKGCTSNLGQLILMPDYRVGLVHHSS